jgi:hypothetical protein
MKKEPRQPERIPSDTDQDASEEVRRFRDQLNRRMTVQQKIGMIFSIYETVKQMTMAGLRFRNPGASERQIWHLWARQHLGSDLYEKVYGSGETKPGNGT